MKCIGLLLVVCVYALSVNCQRNNWNTRPTNNWNARPNNNPNSNNWGNNNPNTINWGNNNPNVWGNNVDPDVPGNNDLDNPPVVPVNPRPTPQPVAPTAANPGIDGNGQLIGCPCNARCPCTHESNVVCGTDGNNYGNLGKLRCAQRCGHNVQLRNQGRCAARDLLEPRP